MVIEKIENNEELKKLISGVFVENEAKYGISFERTPFSFAAKKDGKIVGVVTGYTSFSEVHISELVVLEDHRGSGIGKMLVETVEEYFAGKEFKYITLTTYEYQAPKFYEKLGFMLEFIRKNPDEPKLNKYYYVKCFK